MCEGCPPPGQTTNGLAAAMGDSLAVTSRVPVEPVTVESHHQCLLGRAFSSLCSRRLNLCSPKRMVGACFASYSCSGMPRLRQADMHTSEVQAVRQLTLPATRGVDETASRCEVAPVHTPALRCSSYAKVATLRR